MSTYSYEKKFDVVIVGGGVIGCSIAYHLARDSQGRLKIAVLERNIVGEEASGVAAGMLAAQVECDSPSPLLSLAIESRSRFEKLSSELKELSGVDIEYVRKGIVSTAFDSNHESQLKQRFDWQKREGLNCEWLGPDQIKTRFPFLNSGALGAFWAPDDGQVNSSRLVEAFKLAAIKMGVMVLENENFDRIELRQPRLNQVETNLSKLIADQFVFAAGSWTGNLTGKQTPIEPVKGQILIFEIPAKLSELQNWESPIYFGQTPGDEPIGCYFVPRKDGRLLLGATMEKRGFDKSENKDATKRMLKYASQVFPKLSSLPLKSVWVGLRPAAPDGLPILGLLPGFDNVYVASGHFRNGILLSPITGEIFSRLILHQKSHIAIDAFSPQRFKK